MMRIRMPRKIQSTVVKAHRSGRKMYHRLMWRGSRYACSFCNHSYNRFLSAGYRHGVLKEKRVVGGGYRKNATCPFCGSRDRERLVHLFLESHKLLKPRMRLLHLAPERNLQKILEKRDIEYFSADADSPLAKIKMDIQNIEFPADYFDAIICNHVLEHIINDRKAMKELHRVLKPKGWAILQVPYSPVMRHTFEDPSITTTIDRARIFGQPDHVRMYGTDYLKRLRSVGFSVKQERTASELIKRFALNPEEMIFFCTK